MLPLREVVLFPGVTAPMNLRISLVAMVMLAAVACSPSGSQTPGPSIIPAPSGGGTFGPAELRLLLTDRLGPLWYCASLYKDLWVTQ